MANRPDSFRGMDLTSPQNRLPAGKTALAVNVRAYTEGGFALRNGLGPPIIMVDSSINSLCRMNDTTPTGPENGYCYIIVTDSGSVFVDPMQVATGLSTDPVSIIPFRPNTSVKPWAYIADSSMSVELQTRYALNDSSATFNCFGQIKVRSDGLVYKTGIQEPALAPSVSTQSGIVIDSGPLFASAVPWNNYQGANQNYNFDQTDAYNGQPGGVAPFDGTAPFIVNCANASTITIPALYGTVSIGGAPATPATLGPSTGSSTNPGHFIQIAGSGGTPATATVVVGAFTDGNGNVIAKGVAPLWVPSVVDVGAAFSGASTIQVPFGAQDFQIGINTTNLTFSQDSGAFGIVVEVTTDAEPPTVGILGTLSLSYWGDSPTSGGVASYLWKNPDDPGGGIPRSISNAVGSTTGNSLIFDASFTGGIPGLPGVGSPSLPMQWTSLSPESAAIGSAPVFPSPITATYPTNNQYSNFNFCVYGKIYIPAAGQYTFVLTNHDDCIWGIQDATFISATVSGSGEGGGVSLSDAGQTITVAQGYPLLPRQTYTHGDGGLYAQTTVVVSFTAPGIYGIEIDYDYWFHSGRILLLEASPTPGASPTIIPPLTQAVRTNVSYAGKYRSSLTGAQSNPSPTTTPATTPVLANTVSLPYSFDPQVDKCDFYRQDAGLPNYTYVGTGPNTFPPTPIVDALTDLEAANNQLLSYTDYEPVPSIDLPQSGVVNVSGGVVTWVSGNQFNTRWLPGTIMLIGYPTQLPYTFISRPLSNTQVAIAGVPDGTNLVYNIAEPILANQPLAYMFGPTDNINYIFAVGDSLRPGTLYWCSGSNLDAWPQTNQFDVTDPGELLVNGAMSGGLGVLFSIRRAWIILPNFYNALANVTGTSGSTWTLQATSINRGLFIPRCVAVEGGGNIFFRVDDGIHWSHGGSASASITDDDLYPLFVHEGSTPQPIVRNGVTVYPPNDNNPQRQQFSIQNGYLYYDYAYFFVGPVAVTAPFTPAAVTTTGQGIPWLDPAYATGTGIGSDQIAQIVGFSIAGGVVAFSTIPQTDPLVAGQTVTISGMGVGTYFNGQTLTVLADGLGTQSFSATFFHPNVGATFDAGLATPTTTFAYAQNVSYSPPGGQHSVLTFPEGAQQPPDVASGSFFAEFAPWSFAAAPWYAFALNGQPFAATVSWQSTSIAIPSLPNDAAVQSMYPLVIGISRRGGALSFMPFSFIYPDASSHDFNLDGTLHQGPLIGTDLSSLSATSFEEIVTSTEEEDLGSIFSDSINITFHGVVVNYTTNETPISPTQLQTLVATSLGLNIPGAAPLAGIKVNLQTGMFYGSSATLFVQLTLNGVAVGNQKGLSVGPWATSYVLGGASDTWGLTGLTGAQVNGASGLGVNVSGNLPADAQINLNDLSGEVFYVVVKENDGSATLVYDIRAKGWILDQYALARPTVHAPNEGQSQQGTLAGCGDGTLRLMESNAPETVTGIVLTAAIGGTGWISCYEATFEYSCESAATVSFIAVDADNDSYAPNPITLPSTGGAITKFTTKVTANKWKLLQAQFESIDSTLQVYQEGCVLSCKPWGADGLFDPIPMFRPAGGRGPQE